MKRILIALLFSAALASPALAGQPVPAVPNNWTGLYLGGNIGYGWGSGTSPAISAVDNNTAFNAFFLLGGNGFPGLSPKGVIGGGQIGYDHQLGSLVLGAVADFQAADIKASGIGITNVLLAGVINETLSTRLDYLGTVRGRAGITAGNFLFYGSGGLAYGHVHSTLGMSRIAPPLSVVGSGSEMRTGWSAGGGISYMIDPRWKVGVDYIHYDLGRTTVTGDVAGSPGAFITATQRVHGDIVRGTINYKF